MLWAHQHDELPVARAANVRIEGGNLKAVDHFAPAAMYPFADSVLKLIRGGFINACSVASNRAILTRATPGSISSQATSSSNTAFVRCPRIRMRWWKRSPWESTRPRCASGSNTSSMSSDPARGPTPRCGSSSSACGCRRIRVAGRRSSRSATFGCRRRRSRLRPRPIPTRPRGSARRGDAPEPGTRRNAFVVGERARDGVDVADLARAR